MCRIRALARFATKSVYSILTTLNIIYHLNIYELARHVCNNSARKYPYVQMNDSAICVVMDEYDYFGMIHWK